MTMATKERPGATVAKMKKDFKGRKKKIECINIILSWSKDELDPNSEEDLEVANTIVKEFVKKHYSDGARKAISFFQRDGTSGCLHCHLLVMNSNMNGKTVAPQNRFHPNVKKWIDEVNQKYLKPKRMIVPRTNLLKPNVQRRIKPE